MKQSLEHKKKINGPKISVRCPNCHQNGTFETVGINDMMNPNKQVVFGLRKCPNPKCHNFLFFISDKEGNVKKTYPAEVIPFDPEDIPEEIVRSFEEALISHSHNCYIAAAIMIRKTLEEICHDQQCEGDNLKKRLKDLGSKITIPKELIKGMDDLRLLGNDAAHIEARSFNEIGPNEINISIDFTKEILKAVYQYQGLLGRLKSLKKDKE